MAHVLRRLRVSKVALTARGAGKGVRVMLWKRRISKMTFDELMATLPEEQRAIIVAHMEAMTAAQSSESDAEKALAGVTKGAPAAGECCCPQCGCCFHPASPNCVCCCPQCCCCCCCAGAPDGTIAATMVAPAAIMKAAGQAGRVVLERAFAAGELAKVELAKAREDETARKYREQAATLDGMPGTTHDDLATIWRAIDERFEAPVANKTISLLKHLHTAIMGGAAARMTPIGSSAGHVPSTAHGKLEALAKSLRDAKPTLTHAQAYVEALTQHPELYTEYRRDRDAAQ